MSLIGDVKDIIYDEIPLDLTCSHCAAEQDVSEILDQRSDISLWDEMALKVVRKVFESVSEGLDKVSDSELKAL